MISSRFEFDEGMLVRSLAVGGGVARTAVHCPDDPDRLGSWWRAYILGERPKALVGSASVGKISALELFCGPGGLANGFEQAVRELAGTPAILGAIDQDAGAVGVYGRNRQVDSPRVGSVSELVDYKVVTRGGRATFRYLPEIVDDEWVHFLDEVDIVLAGPPCQGHSNLNNHTRGNDSRNQLYLTVPALAIAVGARAVVIENVPAILRDSSNVVGQARELFSEAGYAISEATLHADKMGWPQTRARHFLVATKGPAPLELAQVEGDLAARPLSVNWAIDDLVDAEPDSHMFRRYTMSDENRRRIDWLFANDVYDLPLELRPECHRGGTTYTSVYGRMRPEKPAPTLTTGFMTPGRGRFIHPSRPRTLFPREAARLQGFPDTYDFAPNDDGPPFTAQLTKWIGDAVPMVLGHAATLAAIAPRLGLVPDQQ